MLLEQFADRVLVDPAALVEQWRELEQRMAVFAHAVAHVGDAGRWAEDGSVTMKPWMRAHLRMSDAQAGPWLAQAGLLNRYEHIGEAALSGRVSQGQLAELRRPDRPRYRGLLRDMQREVVDAVTPLDVRSTEQVCDAWRQRADALFDIVAFFNKHHATAGTPRRHPHVTLSIDAGTLDRPMDVDARSGRLVTSTCADAALCDCVLHTVLRDAHGTPVGFGRSRYTVPRSLFRQVAARDGGCRFPRCNRPVQHCEAHHIVYWRNMGLTDYENLVLLCSR
ncbi:MAG: putative nucleic acid binding and endonuclease domain, partial [Actinomycetota bacterium]